MPDEILRVEGLTTWIATNAGVIAATDDVSFSVKAGRTLAIVGESGSGKSVTCQAIMRVLPINARIATGRILFQGADLVRASQAQMQALRGRQLGMILQDPMTSLNPLLNIGFQVEEPLKYHSDGSAKAARREKVADILAKVQIPAAASRLDAFPHQFSGGMRQRVAIAANIVGAPKLLIADEPTTALDVTVQKQILALLRDIQRQTGMAIILVTHDLQTVRQFSDDVAVMYGGRIVESGAVSRVFDRPSHPYTQGLLAAQPDFYGYDKPLQPIPGQPPSLADLPPGCRFAPRCPHAVAACSESYPEWREEVGLSDHRVACSRVEELNP